MGVSLAWLKSQISEVSSNTKCSVFPLSNQTNSIYYLCWGYLARQELFLKDFLPFSQLLLFLKKHVYLDSFVQKKNTVWYFF